MSEKSISLALHHQLLPSPLYVLLLPLHVFVLLVPLVGQR